MYLTPKEKLILIWVSLLSIITGICSFFLFLLGLVYIPIGYVSHKVYGIVRRDKWR